MSQAYLGYCGTCGHRPCRCIANQDDLEDVEFLIEHVNNFAEATINALNGHPLSQDALRLKNGIKCIRTMQNQNKNLRSALEIIFTQMYPSNVVRKVALDALCENRHRFLGEILISIGAVTKENVGDALEIQVKGSPKKIGEIFVEKLLCSEEKIIEALIIQGNKETKGG